MATPILKDLFYNRETLSALGELTRAAYPDFDETAFLADIFTDEWESLALKARVRHVTEALRRRLAVPYPESLLILKEVAPQWTGFSGVVFPGYVAVYGIDFPEISYPALAYFTQFSTAEYAIRPFIERYGVDAIAVLHEWTRDENEHVRRLASEGFRPRLPWAAPLRFLLADPTPALPILEALKADPSEYVRRSVANHLNDISKTHPELVLETVQKWKENAAPSTLKLCKHALRTLLKKGNAAALAFQGCETEPPVTLSFFTIAKDTIALGENLTFEFGLTLAGTEEISLRLAYKIEFVKANERLSPKIFHVSDKNYQAPSEIRFKKNHKFVNLSTRKHYSGEHFISLLINGAPMNRERFRLNTE